MIRIKNILRKKISPLFVALVIATGAMYQSCNFLDIDPYITDLFSLDTVFAKRLYTEKYLYNVYSYMTDEGSVIANQGNSQPWVLITDEGLSSLHNTTHPYNYFANNQIQSANLYRYGDRWNHFYEAIRKANTFIIQAPNCKEVSEVQISQWIGEAMFLKALFYFELMKMWGPVPIVPDEPVSFDTPVSELMIERSTWDECSEYVANLLREAIRLLPTQRMNEGDVGRPLRTSAMAMLSRLLLYTASPLYNGENMEFIGFTNNVGTPYLNPVKSMDKWAAAAAAAKELVELKPSDLHTTGIKYNTPKFPVPEAEQADFPNGVGNIDPYHSYSDMFTGVSMLVSANPEILFSKQVTSMNASNRYPAPRILNGWGDACVTQALVDAYYMADGRTIDDTSEEYPYEWGYTDTDSTFSGEAYMDGFTVLSQTHKWYVNREMRFYATVAYNNSLFSSTTTPTASLNPRDGRIAKFYRNSQSGKDMAQSIASSAEDYPMTGYLCRKFISYEDSWHSGARQTPKYSMMYRMAEIYLNYVEAMNELEAGQTYTVGDVMVSKDPAEMKRCFNLIRYRAGLPGITDADVNNQERMRDLILRERQIEFAWEGHRYHDLRRNKKAMTCENAPVMGCNVNAIEADKDAFHSIIRVSERNYTYKVFTTRQTFFPIPKTEVDKNPNLDQLPGY
ncbi:MAG: RagB/SusD family nutrient uptake outer membrane protein [Tannerella sp.]|nr:RagB/SusD family nutrient uptake outer membrane protein [Tannerella sp.]